MYLQPLDVSSLAETLCVMDTLAPQKAYGTPRYQGPAKGNSTWLTSAGELPAS